MCVLAASLRTATPRQLASIAPSGATRNCSLGCSSTGRRLPPRLIIIGAQKGGTTELFATLREHDEFAAPEHKELHFSGRVPRHGCRERAARAGVVRCGRVRVGAVPRGSMAARLRPLPRRIDGGSGERTRASAARRRRAICCFLKSRRSLRQGCTSAPDPPDGSSRARPSLPSAESGARHAATPLPFSADPRAPAPPLESEATAARDRSTAPSRIIGRLSRSIGCRRSRCRLAPSPTPQRRCAPCPLKRRLRPEGRPRRVRMRSLDGEDGLGGLLPRVRLPELCRAVVHTVTRAGREARRSLSTRDGDPGGGARGRLNRKRTSTPQDSSARGSRREGRRACPEQLKRAATLAAASRTMYASQLRTWLELFATATDARYVDADSSLPGRARPGASPRTGSHELHTAAGRLWVLKSEELFVASDGMARAAERIVQFASYAGPSAPRAPRAASGATADGAPRPARRQRTRHVRTRRKMPWRPARGALWKRGSRHTTRCRARSLASRTAFPFVPWANHSSPRACARARRQTPVSQNGSLGGGRGSRAPGGPSGWGMPGRARARSTQLARPSSPIPPERAAHSACAHEMPSIQNVPFAILFAIMTVLIVP